MLVCSAISSVMVLIAVIATNRHPSTPAPEYGPVRCSISTSVDTSINPAPTQRDRVARRIKRFCDAMGVHPEDVNIYPH